MDYYFLPRAAIASLPAADLYVGPVREMLQAVGLSQFAIDLRSSPVVMVEIFPELWRRLLTRIEERMRCTVPNASVFMTAVHRQMILALPEGSRAPLIQSAVERILPWRNEDALDKISIRAKPAVDEILTAISPKGRQGYACILDSAPERPDGEDEWTKEAEPVGNARRCLDEFFAFYAALSK